MPRGGLWGGGLVGLSVYLSGWWWFVEEVGRPWYIIHIDIP